MQRLDINSDCRYVGLFDAHHTPDKDEFHPAYKIARKYVLDIKPEGLVFGGDWVSLDSLSNWNKKKPLLSEGKRYIDDINCGKDELWRLRYALPDTKMIFIIGNHEKRIDWYVEKNPEMFGGMDMVKDLELDQMEMTIVDFEDFIEIGELAWTHGWYWNMYHARKTMDEFIGNIVYGHVHTHQVWCKNAHMSKKQLMAMCCACLTDRFPEWKGKKPTRFQNGFVTCNYRAGGRFNLDHHMIINGEFSYGGRTWKA